jgi:hypothetical protein
MGMGAKLLDTLASGDGTSDSLAELLQIEAGRATTLPISAQVLGGVVEPESAPHVFFESGSTSAKGKTTWATVTDLGATTSSAGSCGA